MSLVHLRDATDAERTTFATEMVDSFLPKGIYSPIANRSNMVTIGSWDRLIDRRTLREALLAVFLPILASSATTVLVACPTGLDSGVGWVAFSPTTLYYLYVCAGARGIDVASVLMEEVLQRVKLDNVFCLTQGGAAFASQVGFHVPMV